MARNTRATAKAENSSIHIDETATTPSEESTAAASATPQADRPPLAEIAANEVELNPEQQMAQEVTPTKKEKGKGKRKGGKRGKKGKKAVQNQPDTIDKEIGDIALEVIPDRKASSSPATLDLPAERVQQSSVEDASIDVQSSSPLTKSTEKPTQTVDLEGGAVDQPNISSVEELPTTGQVTPGPAADNVETETGSSPLDLGASQAGQKLEQLFVPQDVGEEDALTELTIKDILARSASQSDTAKTMPKEDPIEAMDALEEAIDEIGKSLPNLESKKQVSVAQRKSAEPATIKPGRNVNAAQTAANRKSVVNQPRSTVGVNSKSSAVSASPSLVPSRATPIKNAVVKMKSDIVALHTPVKPAKSTKPVTKASFQLPGEAVAAKLKAEREDRLRKKEETAGRDTDVKAKPAARTSKPVEIKQTAASRARMSIANPPPITANDASEGKGTTIRPLNKSASTARASVANSRVSTLAHRPKPVPRESSASTVRAPHAPRPSNVRSSTIFSSAPKQVHAANTARPRVPSSSVLTGTTAPKQSATASEVVAQKQRARDIFNRDKLEKEALEKVRKEKEEATRKARMEAAEKGRTASREWAEKMRMKNRAAVVSAAIKEAEVEQPVKAVEA